ncbi:MAG: TFIIB-type zinc finger domain-containing protein [Solobacterium sp.]|nr:TFIIB-type zinc finger domain-containing protein [Solobacterium sp.]
MAKLPACPICGSKDVSRIEGFYHCNACRSDFGRKPVADNGKPLIDEIIGLRYRDGDLIQGSLRARFAAEEGCCLYEVYSTYTGEIKKVAHVLSLEEWKEVKRVLLEELYVYDWDKYYIPPNDGREVDQFKGWELSLEVSPDEVYTSGGFGEYPVYFKGFLKLMDPLLSVLKG